MTYHAGLDRCYVVSTAAALPPTVDYEAAFTHCKSLGSDVNLVAIQTQEENDYVDSAQYSAGKPMLVNHKYSQMA